MSCSKLSKDSSHESENLNKLSEVESFKIVKSPEYQTGLKLQFLFLEKIEETLKKGYTIGQLEAEALAANSKNENTFYQLVFGSTEKGNEYIKSLQESRKIFLEKNPILIRNKSQLTCSTCKLSSENELKWFFKYFDNLNQMRKLHLLSKSGDQATIVNDESIPPTEGPTLPTCGSYWNQVRLLGCVALCSATTAGLGAAAC